MWWFSTSWKWISSRVIRFQWASCCSYRVIPILNRCYRVFTGFLSYDSGVVLFPRITQDLLKPIPTWFHCSNQVNEIGLPLSFVDMESCLLPGFYWVFDFSRIEPDLADCGRRRRVFLRITTGLVERVNGGKCLWWKWLSTGDSSPSKWGSMIGRPFIDRPTHPTTSFAVDFRSPFLCFVFLFFSRQLGAQLSGYWVESSCYRFLLRFIWFYRVWSGLTGFYPAKLGFTEFYWVRISQVGFYRVFLGLI